MKNHGITLIALVITIIVLLILAGVSISTISGDNGIVKKAKDAKEKTEQAEKEELESLGKLEQYINDKTDENQGDNIMAAGLYETGTTNLIYSWEQLLSDGAIIEMDGILGADYKVNPLAGDLRLPADGSITVLPGFYHCDITSIIIPASVTKIYMGTLSYCRYIESIIFEGTMEQWYSIDVEDYWNDCASVNARMVICSDGVVHIPGLYNNKQEMWPDGRVVPTIYEVMSWDALLQWGGAVVDDGGLWLGSEDRFCGYLILPADGSITYIGQFFYTIFDGIVIPNTVVSIWEEALSESYLLKSITVPSSVTSIGDYALGGCHDLETIIFEGTVEQWNSIELGEDWNAGVPATEVVCTDGTVSL